MADEEEYQITFPTDSDGFVGFRCSSCGYRFRLSTEEFSAADGIEMFCPACGLPNVPCSFITDEMTEYVEAFAESIMAEKLNAMFDNMERQCRSSKALTFKRGKRLAEDRPVLPSEPDDLISVCFPCCGRRAKVGATSDAEDVYCPYCGVK